MSIYDHLSGARIRETPRPTLVGLIVALLGLPLLAGLMQLRAFDPRPLVAVAVQWSPLVVVAWITVRWEDRSLQSLGVRRPTLVDTGYLFVTTLLGFLALAATGPLVEALGLPQAEQTGLGVAQTGLGVAVANAITIGIVEESLYRGYAIERLSEYTGSVVLAGGLSWGVFTLAHASSWQLGDLVQVSLAALVFTVVYLRRRSLVPVVGAHISIWVFGILGALYG